MGTRNRKIELAVAGGKSSPRNRLLDKAFAFAFKGLVYAQIWEDPVVDMAGLDIQPDSRVAAIASGGCNVLSYLTANPAQLIAVDLNTAHIALNKLKIAAVRHLPSQAHFHRFFAQADTQDNVAAYNSFVRPHLDETSRRYWEGRDLMGRRRITGFAHGLYRRGLLGNFIGGAHILAKLYRIDPRELLMARDIEEQREIFETRLAPIFDRKFVRWLTEQPASLFGLGIPPAQYSALAGDDKMADVLRARLKKLACDFDLSDNYFAWQAFGRSYGKGKTQPLPPYLQPAHYKDLCDRVDRVDVRHASMTEMLADESDDSMDRFVLLDAQDWMNDTQLNQLWAEITRTARPGARVLFRTAAKESLLPGRVETDILRRWHYDADLSANLTRDDRSSIYGGVHLYQLR